MKKILTTLLFLALCATGFSQSSALNVSSTLAGNAGYQPLIARGVTNGYAPLDSNALVPGTNLFPGFVSATNGSFWVKSGSGLAVVQGLTFTSNTISMSHVNVGLIENDALTLYGISLDSGFNQPIVIRGGQSTIYFATAQTVGAANTGYTGFSWSISGPGNFYLGSGTITGNLSLPSASASNGLSINFSNSVFSSTNDFVFTNANVIVSNLGTNGFFNTNSAVVSTYRSYALNSTSADNLYARVYTNNTWPLLQTFSGGIALPSALTLSNGGTGGTNQVTAQSSLGLSIGTNVEAYSSSLNQIGTLGVPTSNSVLVGGSTNWVLQTASQFVGSLGLSIGTNVQAFSSNLTSVSAVVPTNNYVLIGGVSTNWTNASPASLVTTLGLSIGTNVQAFNANLQSISSIGTPSANQFLASISSSWTAVSGSTARAAMGVSIGTNVQAYSSNLQAIASGTPVPLSLGGTGGTNASNSLVNLGIGNGITTNITLISISTTNTAAFVTNTIGISNGIITNWTQVGL